MTTPWAADVCLLHPPTYPTPPPSLLHTELRHRNVIQRPAASAVNPSPSFVPTLTVDLLLLSYHIQCRWGGERSFYKCIWAWWEIRCSSMLLYTDLEQSVYKRVEMNKKCWQGVNMAGALLENEIKWNAIKFQFYWQSPRNENRCCADPKHAQSAVYECVSDREFRVFRGKKVCYSV